MINEDKLFKLLPAFFDKPSKVIIEIAQNAFRSGAKSLDISIKNDTLKVIDDGSGTDNPHALFCLAESGWSEDVMEQQMPAGWGLFYLMSLSMEVVYTSMFGTIAVNCESFLNDRAYRDNILDLVDTSTRTERGFSVEATLKEGVAKSLCDGQMQRHLRYFRMDITYNGGKIERENLSDRCKDYDIKTSYLGNDVYINAHLSTSLTSFNEHFLNTVMLVWYGIPINEGTYMEQVVIDVRKNNPLTPVLPYRSSISFDEKAREFIEFVRSKVGRWCLNKIRNYDCTKESVSTMASIMDLAAEIVPQEALDSLDIFHLTEVDPYHSDDVESDEVRERRIVRRSQMPLVSEALRLEIDGKIIMDGEDEELASCEKPILPPWTIKSVKLPSKKPSWLTTTEEKISLKVTKQEGINREYNWVKSTLECKDKDISVIVLPWDNCGGLDICYSGDPEDFYLVDDAVFYSRVYSSDYDTYDTQRYEYDGRVSADIQHLTGRYNLYDLLKGVNIAGVRYVDVKTINVDRESKTFQIISNNGKSVVLKLAA